DRDVEAGTETIEDRRTDAGVLRKDLAPASRKLDPRLFGEVGREQQHWIRGHDRNAEEGAGLARADEGSELRVELAVDQRKDEGRDLQGPARRVVEPADDRIEVLAPGARVLVHVGLVGLRLGGGDLVDGRDVDGSEVGRAADRKSVVWG